MRRILRLRALLLLIVLASPLIMAQENPHQQAPANNIDLIRAVAKATAKLQTALATSSEYTLIKAELLWKQGKYIWRLSYKLARLLPKDPTQGLIGKGGEIFVDVELDTDAIVIRYGE